MDERQPAFTKARLVPLTAAIKRPQQYSSHDFSLDSARLLGQSLFLPISGLTRKEKLRRDHQASFSETLREPTVQQQRLGSLVGPLCAPLSPVWKNFCPQTTLKKQLFQLQTFYVRDCFPQQPLTYSRHHRPPHLK